MLYVRDRPIVLKNSLGPPARQFSRKNSARECPQINYSDEITKVEHFRARSIFWGKVFQQNRPEPYIQHNQKWLPKEPPFNCLIVMLFDCVSPSLLVPASRNRRARLLPGQGQWQYRHHHRVHPMHNIHSNLYRDFESPH